MRYMICTGHFISKGTCDCVPHTDLQHATEELWVVGDNPADVNNKLLLQHGFSLAVRAALAVDDVLNDPWRQGVGYHDLLLSE